MFCEECGDDELRKKALRLKQEKFVRCPDCGQMHVLVTDTCKRCSWSIEGWTNPNWERPSDWPEHFPDFGSPMWERLMWRRDKRLMERRTKFGFGECPECGTMHTALTLTCRNCEYKAKTEGCPEW